MMGGGVSGMAGQKIGGSIYVGIKRSGDLKLIVEKVATPLLVNDGFRPVGFGYARDKNGQGTHTASKMRVHFDECLRLCASEATCSGFDCPARITSVDWHQCNLRFRRPLS